MNSRHIGIIGCGLIGRSWSIAFARGGYNVRLYDPVRGTADHALVLIGEAANGMHKLDLLHGLSVSEILKSIKTVGSLSEVVQQASFVQENSPESADTKIKLFTELDTLIADDTIIASSTSAILPSVFTSHVRYKERCLVVHPLNPPHLIRAVEIVPSPWTSSETLEKTRLLMVEIGQRPILLKKEIDGFVMNRLQGALLEECFRLVDADIASADDIDACVRDGLALRWSFMGPFETIDLNAPAGIADYVERYQAGFERQFKTQTTRVDWSGPVLKQVSTSRRALVPLDDLAKRQAWRDARLMDLVAHQRKANKLLGE